MPVFEHRDKGYTVITSYKAMYSTVKNQGGMREIAQRPTPRLFLRKILRRRSADSYGICRSPYARLVSFHADKLVQQPQLAHTPNFELQPCHTVILEALGAPNGLSAQEGAERLSGVSFEDLIELLPSIFRKEPHLAPQTESFQITLPLGAAFRWPVSQIFKMETDIGELEKALGYDCSRRRNASKHADVMSYYSTDALRTVNRLYRDDFQNFGYEQKT